MSITLDRTAHETATTSTAPGPTPVPARAEAPCASPLGGSYVTRTGSADLEGTYVTTSTRTTRPRRGSYVTAPAAVCAIGSYTDTHGAARA